MILNGSAFENLLRKPLEAGVYYFYATQEYPVRSGAARTVRALQKQEDDTEWTRVDGPAPSIGEAVAAAGTISLFGTKRIVELSMIEPSAMNEADVTALSDLVQSLENAVIVMTTVFKDEKAKGTKKAKQLIDAADRAGVVVEFEKLRPQELRRFVQERAAAEGAALSPTAASVLLERCGTDQFTLENEIAKLAAACGYGEITEAWIERAATPGVEANVFDMVRLVSAKSRAKALEKLTQLFALGNDPIAIAAALASSFIDMYRIKCAGPGQRRPGDVHKDFGGKGSDYRMRKANETAQRYSRAQLEAILEILLTLDASMKSSSTDNEILLTAALCEIMETGARV